MNSSLFQSYQYDPDVCARLQNITQHGVIWYPYVVMSEHCDVIIRITDQH